MSGVVELTQLLNEMSPELDESEYVFCSLDKRTSSQVGQFSPLATFLEDEGLTVVTKKEIALSHNLDFNGCFKRIVLTVHSSLEAVGLTAAVSTALAKENISANVIAAYYHDHIFIPIADAEKALAILRRLTS